MADITVSTEGFQHLDNSDAPSSIGKVELTTDTDSYQNDYLVIRMRSHENNVAIRMADLRRALRALDESDA